MVIIWILNLYKDHVPTFSLFGLLLGLLMLIWMYLQASMWVASETVVLSLRIMKLKNLTIKPMKL